MRMEQRQPCRQPVVRHAVDAYFAVVVRHIFNQPLDRVVGVIGFVGLFGIVCIVSRGHQEHAFRFESPAEILDDKDITVCCQFLPVCRHPIGAVLRRRFIEFLLRRHSIGGASQQNRQSIRLIFPRDHYRLKVHPIPHGHHELLQPPDTLRRSRVCKQEGSKSHAQETVRGKGAQYEYLIGPSTERNKYTNRAQAHQRV